MSRLPQRSPALAISLILALVGPLSPVAQAQTPPATSDFQDNTTLPSDATSLAINAFIAAYNANDAKAVRSFLEKYTTPEFQQRMPLEQHLNMFLNLRRTTGPIKLHSLRSRDASQPKPELIFKDSVYGNWHAVTLGFGTEPQPRINEIRFAPAPAPKNQVISTPLTEAQMLEQAQKLVQSGCDKDVFSGSAVIAHGKKIVLQISCGEASKRYHVKNNADTSSILAP